MIAEAFGKSPLEIAIELYSNTIQTKMKQEERTLEFINDCIEQEVELFKKQLIQKNVDYNNSLHQSKNLFGQNPIEGLKARMSDKLNRIIAKGVDDKTEDSLMDLFGYYIHYQIMQKLDKENSLCDLTGVNRG